MFVTASDPFKSDDFVYNLNYANDHAKNLSKASQTPGNHYLFLQCLKMQAANSLRSFLFFYLRPCCFSTVINVNFLPA